MNVTPIKKPAHITHHIWYLVNGQNLAMIEKISFRGSQSSSKQVGSLQTNDENLAKNLSEKSMTIIYDPPSDGSCFFHAVIYSLGRMQGMRAHLNIPF